MTQPDWPTRIAAQVAAEVQRHRKRRGMSAQQLADRCGALGMPIARSVIANFESGRRNTISVAEVMVVARALNVPPLELMFPVGYAAAVEVLPGQTASPLAAAEWFAGNQGWPVGLVTLRPEIDESLPPGEPLKVARRHAQVLAELEQARARIANEESHLGLTGMNVYEIQQRIAGVDAGAFAARGNADRGYLRRYRAELQDGLAGAEAYLKYLEHRYKMAVHAMASTIRRFDDVVAWMEIADMDIPDPPEWLDGFRELASELGVEWGVPGAAVRADGHLF